MMAWLKVYEWEYDTWPEFQTLQVNREDQIKYIKKLSRHFKIDRPRLKNSLKRGANASSQDRGAAGQYVAHPYWPIIKLGTMTTLGTLVHEFAHHLTFRRCGQGHRHDRKFKRELKRVYTWAKRYLPNAQEEKNYE